MSPDSLRRARFEAIAGEVFDPLQRYLRRRVPADDASDLFGDIMLTIWRRVDDVPDGAALPWAYGVARRIVSNHRRSSQRRLRLIERLEAQPASDLIVDPADALDDPEIADAMAALPAADQEIIRLWAWEQLEPRQIAEVLGSTSNAVSLRLSRARKKLGESLSRQDPPPAGHIGDRHAEEQTR